MLSVIVNLDKSLTLLQYFFSFRFRKNTDSNDFGGCLLWPTFLKEETSGSLAQPVAQPRIIT